MTLSALLGADMFEADEPESVAGTNGRHSDEELLNFALNLEYLEPEYYLRAVTSNGLHGKDAGTNPGVVDGGSRVPFTTKVFRNYANEIAEDELIHVRFLREVPGSAAACRPNIDFFGAFGKVATAAGLGKGFNPFADEVSFFVGATVFKDCCVDAHRLPLMALKDKTLRAGSSAILGIESYHSALINVLINQMGSEAARTTTAIRSLYGRPKEVQDKARAAEPTAELLQTLYLGNIYGGFFPSGLNGAIR